MAEADDSGDHIAKEKSKFRYKKELRTRDGEKRWVNVGTPIKQPEPYKTSYGSVITGEYKPESTGKRRISKKMSRTKTMDRKFKSHGGGVGIQTHGNKLAKDLNTQTPDHSVYLNEDNYLKGGIKIRS